MLAQGSPTWRLQTLSKAWYVVDVLQVCLERALSRANLHACAAGLQLACSWPGYTEHWRARAVIMKHR